MFEVERAVTYYPKDTEYLREQRKTFSTLEQIMSKNGERGSKKVCQKYIKACNLLLTEITGYTNGNVNSTNAVNSAVVFPVELESFLRGLYLMEINYSDLWSNSLIEGLNYV